jgi:transposase
MIAQWKRRAQAALPDLFAKKSERTDAAHEEEVKQLHAKIGQLSVENDFLAKAFGR